MAGTLALLGGGEFSDLSEALDRRLLAASGGTEVVVLPTADAFEHPERLVTAAEASFAGLGATVQGAMVLRRIDALDPSSADHLTGAKFVYVVGDSQLHLKSVLKQTPLWDALLAVLDRGGVVAASGASASALCDPMLDSRGGGVTLGLELVTGLVFVPHAETLTAEWLKRTRSLAGTATVVEARTGSAIVRTDAGWECLGAVEVHGELPLS